MARLFSRPDPEADRIAQQDRLAGQLLVQADDQVRVSQEELAFVRASVGEFETQRFAQALAQAQANLAEAFRLRQQLDDDMPDSIGQRDEWSRRIIALAQHVMATLAAQGEAFEKLRAIGRDLPQMIAYIRSQLAELTSRHQSAAAMVAGLRSQYAPAVSAKADDDLAQAASFLTLAGRALEASERRLGTGVQDQAPATIDAARAALGRADKLLDSLEALEGDLVTAQVDLTQLQAHGAQVVVQSRKAVVHNDQAGHAAIDALERLLAGAGNGLSGDPIGDAARLRAAIQAAEAPLVARRTAVQRAEAAKQALPGQLRQARDYIQWVEDFAASRRARLGPQARTRLAEARRHVSLAEQNRDPVAAFNLAQRASQLATDAWNIAHADLERPRVPQLPGRSGNGEGKAAAIAVGAAVGGLLLGTITRGWGRSGIDIGDLFD